jgi:hypothetical protein
MSMDLTTGIPLRSAMKHPSRPASPVKSRTAPASLPSSQQRNPLVSRPTSSTYSSATSHVQRPFSPSFTSKVSFDTFENPAASMFSFTLQVKTDGYRRTRSTRVFLCAASLDESGREALDWAIESLVQDGDELIVCRGVDPEELGETPVNVFCVFQLTARRDRQRS